MTLAQDMAATFTQSEEEALAAIRSGLEGDPFVVVQVMESLVEAVALSAYYDLLREWV